MPAGDRRQQTNGTTIILECRSMSIDDPTVIDFVTLDRDGAVVLVMVEGRPWGGSEPRLEELKDKVRAYETFVRSGEIYEKYPTLTGKPVVFELRSVNRPDPATQRFIDDVRSRLEAFSIGFSVKQIGTRPSE